MTDTTIQLDDTDPAWLKPGARLFLIEHGSGYHQPGAVWVSPVVIDRILKRDIVGIRQNVSEGDGRRVVRWRRDSYRPPSEDSGSSWAHGPKDAYDRLGSQLLLPEGHPDLPEHQARAALTRAGRKYSKAVSAYETDARTLTSKRNPETAVKLLRAVADTAREYAAEIDKNGVIG